MSTSVEPIDIISRPQRDRHHDSAVVSSSVSSSSSIVAVSPPSPSSVVIPSVPEDAPLPMKRVIVLSLINLNEGFQANLIWPFVPFMVARFFDTDEADGLYVGILGSAFHVAQFLSSAIWGSLTDRYGRKPCLLSGLAGSGLAMLMFGFSTNYIMAVSARFISGLLNGNVAITKAYMGEVTNKSTQAKGFSYLMFVFSFGASISPSIGGFLADPASFSSAFDNNFWRTYPYLLPCLFTCLVATTGTIMGLIMLPESEVWLARRKARLMKEEQAHASLYDSQSNSDRNGTSSNGSYQTLSDNNGNGSHHGTNGDDEHTKNREAGDENGTGPAAIDIDLLTTKKSSSSSSSPLDGERQSLISSISSSDMSDKDAAAAQNCCVRRMVFLPVPIRNSRVLITVLLWFFICIAMVMDAEMLPLFCQLEESKGGLGFDTNRIGILLSVAGGAMLINQGWLYPRFLAKRFAPTTMFKICVGCLVPYFLLLPTTHLLMNAASPQVFWVILCIMVAFKACLGATLGTCITICVNNSATLDYRGRVHGIGQSTAAMGRSMGPIGGGALWAWSISLSSPIRSYLTYFLQGGIMMAVFLLTIFQLPYSLNFPPAATVAAVERAYGKTVTTRSEPPSSSSPSADNGAIIHKDDDIRS